MAAELAEMLENYKDDIPKLKELLRKVIRKIEVNSREEILPFIRLPLVRVMTGAVEVAGHNQNHLRLLKVLLARTSPNLKSIPRERPVSS